MESIKEMRRCGWLSKLSAMKGSRSPRRMLGAWCPTPRSVGRPQQNIGQTLKKLGFGEDLRHIRHLREWMAVARDRPVSVWGRKVVYKLDLPPGSLTNLRRY
jgi:hypothetical protein